MNADRDKILVLKEGESWEIVDLSCRIVHRRNSKEEAIAFALPLANRASMPIALVDQEVGAD